MLQVKRSGLDRTRKRRPRAAGRVLTDPIDRLILEVARASPSDGSRMVAALAGREFGRQVNRKRAQGVMRMERLLQRQRPLRRRRRPGFFRVECPDQLWQLEMTSVWVAEPGWCYVNAAIDCCTGEIVGWSLELRCRSEAAPALVDTAVAAGGIEPAALTLPSAATMARPSPAAASAPGSPNMESGGAAATATPNRRHSSKAGSES